MRPGIRRRRRVLLGIGAALVLVLAGAAIAWVASGAHEVSLSAAAERFSHDQHGAGEGAGGLGRPAAGVYSYRGSGTESLSFPPKTEHDGPVIPGTVTHGAGRCWTLRLDFNDEHWQSWSYCPNRGGLLETARAGWYSFALLSLELADTSRFTCSPPEIVVPAAPGRETTFTCRGVSRPLALGPVTLAGSVRYLGTGRVDVGGVEVPALHVRETARLTGGQRGSDIEDTWYAERGDLPLEGSWSTDVRTSTPIGATTLHASGRFALGSLTPLR